MESHTKIFLFTIMDMWQSKIQNAYKSIVWILYNIFSTKWMDTLKKLMEVNIER